MRKNIFFILILLVICLNGCNDSKNLTIAYDVKSKKSLYEDTVSLLKTSGDLLASQINSKMKLFMTRSGTSINMPTSDEIMKLQNSLILMQTRKIEEQDKYINELENIICQLVDPKREIITAK